ncbi:MAG: RNA methyltransferase [Candidatus Nanohaloarchaea archaeon]|nr:RNA methyltransferase [Candidatus Nanohaloarchaea archaeon]
MPSYNCIVVEPEIEGNLGFLARTMANFEIEELVLVNPQFQIGEEARNRAVHAQEIIDNARIFESMEGALDTVDFAVGTTGIEASSSNPVRKSITPEEVAERASEVEGDIGIVLGRESKGLSNQELERCDLVAKVPTSEEYPVMNITHAAAVIFYQLFKERGENKDRKASDRSQKKVLENIFKDTVELLGLDPEEQERSSRVLRNFVGRSFLDRREANTLIGTLKKVNQKLGEKK